MRYLSLVVYCLLFQSGYSQLYDKTWICGTWCSKVTFNNSSIDTVGYDHYINAESTWVSLSDSAGNFQFFSEGVNVYGADGNPMVNGELMADNLVNQDFRYGLPDEQNVLALPKKETQYYLFNQSLTDSFYTAATGWLHPNILYCSTIDMSLQFGKGQVTEKRRLINTGSFMDGHLTACQHANGRDWWLVQRGYNNNHYFIYLVSPDTIQQVREQVIGAASLEPDAFGQSAFSPDGNKYATVTPESPLIILDFDRCEGIFSNPLEIPLPVDSFTFYTQQKIRTGGHGLCFSPNNRFIYINNIYVLRQYDLLQNPVDSSGKVIFFWTDSNEYLGQFDMMHLAPNGKMYAASTQGFTYALHVINYPDSAGLSCGFQKWGLPFPTINAVIIPNMVHFRMGALAGSGCDTIATGVPPAAADKRVRVYPNPANDVVAIDLLSYSQYHPQQQFYLYDIQGRLVKQVALPYLSAQLRVGDLPTGTYQWQLAVNSEIKATGKLEVVR
jgi:hypothetical protein